MSDIIEYPDLHLLALEHTGWRRWVFGRWVYNSEPFRRDIQRQLAKADFRGLCKKYERFYPPKEAQEQSDE